MRNEEWNAIIHCDSAYDGQFFYAVRTTGIVCRPSCQSRNPKRDHVIVFRTMEGAVGAGFRACKRCRPDQGRWPAEDLVHETQTYMRDHRSEPLTLGRIADALHISPYHLHRVFKRVTGLTPMAYLVKHRLTVAQQLLTDTELTMTDVGATVGFTSSAHFSTVLRKEFGQSPTAYRRQRPISDVDIAQMEGV